MTFGQTLKQLLTLSGIKSAHLADALGYDTSYISPLGKRYQVAVAKEQ